jgi:ribosomal protein S18 acetylase RimI-like enzyme
VIHYRTFRNFDPPGLLQVWNEAFTGRGTAYLRITALMEFFLFAKPYFDPEGVIVACSGEKPVGFAMAGFGPDGTGNAVDTATGVTCLVGVVPSLRRQGIGAELLRRSEEYLRRRGAQALVAGPVSGLNPYTFGLYGGSSSPGFLASDPLARPFLEHHGYQVRNTTVVFRRPLDRPLALADGRFPAYRQRFEIHAGLRPAAGWWQEGALGPVEMYQYQLFDKVDQRVVARAYLWEMDTFRPRWNDHGIGIVELEVDPPQRRQGLAKFLLSQILLHLQEQFFSMVELQVRDENAAAVQLLGGLGFTEVDRGHSYLKGGIRNGE